jgi:hypothetical protein
MNNERGPRSRVRVSATSKRWGARVGLAADIDEVLQIVQSFLAACGPIEIAMLSQAGAPLGCASINDLKGLVIRLSLPRAVAAATGGAHTRLKRLFDFMTEAASRFAQLEFEGRAAFVSAGPILSPGAASPARHSLSPQFADASVMRKASPGIRPRQ